ncbi:VOC family protein [Chryseobacterium sp. M5A1_1a]
MTFFIMGKDCNFILTKKCNIMKPKMIWANLAVINLERTQKFYTELGFKPNNPNSSNELVSFFVGEKDFVIHFFLKNILETNVKNVNFGDSRHSNEIIFTLSAESKEQTDQWAKEVEQAGGKIISPPESFGNNYYGFVFADPDGHKFNVFHM